MARSRGTAALDAPPPIEHVKEVLRGLMEQNAGIPGSLIRDDSSIDGDLAMDSMSFVSLQVAVEDTFGIRCDAEDLEARRRFDAMAALIQERIEAPSRRKKPTATTARMRSATAARARRGTAARRTGGKSRKP
jgi:acyl carrier protein